MMFGVANSCVLCVVYNVLLVGMSYSHKVSANMYKYVIERMCMLMVICLCRLGNLLPGVCNLGSVWYIVQCLCYAAGKDSMSVVYIYVILSV